MKSCITLGTFSVFLSTAAQENLSRLPESEIALLRADIQTKETDILQQNLALSDERAKKFWFVQRSYENDLLKLGDKRLDVVREYTNWDNLNDATARDSGQGPLKYQKKRVWIFVPGTPTGCQKRYRPLSRQNSSTDPAIICTSFSDDRTRGSHILQCRGSNLRLQIQREGDYYIALPETEDFLKADLRRDPAADLAQAEGEDK
jgi:hypothetical protein